MLSSSVEAVILLLRCFKVNSLMFLCKGSEIDVDCLENMQEVDFVQLIPKINLRIKFRARLDEWKRHRCLKEADIKQEKTLLTGLNGVIRNLDILPVLQSTESGKDAVKYYKQEALLNDVHRKKVIKTVVEYFVQRNVALGTKECNTIADKIVQLFPNELKVERTFVFPTHHIYIDHISNAGKLFYTCF